MTKTSRSLLRSRPAPSVVTVPGALPYGRRDHLIGALVALAVIAGAAGLGELAKGRHPKRQTKSLRSETPVFEMPPLQPDPADMAPEDEAKTSVDLRPPMLPDVPTMGRPSDIVQPLEPPPPDSLDGKGSVITIPPDTAHWDGGGKIFDPSQLDRQPVPVSQTHPTYPFEMRRDGLSGEVVVDFIVDAGGHVSRAFASSSSNREFESGAVAAVAKWRFQPGRKNGRAVNTHMQVPVVFTLNPDS